MVDQDIYIFNVYLYRSTRIFECCECLTNCMAKLMAFFSESGREAAHHHMAH